MRPAKSSTKVSSGITERMGVDGLRRGQVLHPQQVPQGGLLRVRVGREVGVADDEVIAVAMARSAPSTSALSRWSMPLSMVSSRGGVVTTMVAPT